ncbi:Uncharacterised protein [Mycobacteroides abscessus subsp. bolletii]|nr:Uncharacterised protein [Mycobacteroides abscessus subsp. bolletii]SHT28332.1 Uncharacterised protein [Mycobacteroides abscessus subsp. bolletii]SHT48843.1 Uncharacterised protein [Mycobacteroides abscessus subsp. bolletii]SKH02033.1 Uncharacterised protein [Mycobacteroides abscessus subsp. bolletii]SKI93140.1 Uncharacterised protein [Mycobacteroides abscessus subsp. bolletii]
MNGSQEAEITQIPSSTKTPDFGKTHRGRERGLGAALRGSYGNKRIYHEADKLAGRTI